MHLILGKVRGMSAVLRLRAKNTAPGPDGIHDCVLALALKELEL